MDVATHTNRDPLSLLSSNMAGVVTGSENMNIFARRRDHVGLIKYNNNNKKLFSIPIF